MADRRPSIMSISSTATSHSSNPSTLTVTSHSTITLHTRRRPRAPSLFLTFGISRSKSTSCVASPIHLTPGSSPTRSSTARLRHHSHTLTRLRPTPRSSPLSSSHPGSPFELDYIDISALPHKMPPTPSPPVNSQPDSLMRLHRTESESVQSRMYREFGESPAGPSKITLPPTPPSHIIGSPASGMPLEDRAASVNGTEPGVPQRPRRGRRPASVYPAAAEEIPYLPTRKYTDPTPRSLRYLEGDESPNPDNRLDVDLDAYSTTDYDVEDAGLEEREPTLSFVTTSTVESTTGTPSIGVQYGFRTETSDGKSEMEPRIRMRTTAGRTNAYSSAESSMASNAYSYHAYPDNQIYHPHPPPLPTMPHVFAPQNEQVGLGISAHDITLARPIDSLSHSPVSNAPISPTDSFRHRPWHRDVANRLRSGSGSSSITTTTASTDDDRPEADGSTSSHALTYPYTDYALSDRLPWEKELPTMVGEGKAVAMVAEGKERILDRTKIEEMGGIEAVTEEMITSLAGVTHLLLPSFGSSLLPILPSLLTTLAPTLVVLDLSGNDLSFIPDSLSHSSSLEELNISGNPLRRLPGWFGELTSLRVLVVDDCEIAGLPVELSHLASLHTICARRNRLVALPSWLCLLGQLETLRVDDNPFAPEWVPVVAPILAGPSQLSRPLVPRRTSSQRRSPGAVGREGLSMTSLASSLTASSIASASANTGYGEMPWMSPSPSANQSMYQISNLHPITEDYPRSAPPQPREESGRPGPVEPMTAPISDTPSFVRGLRKMRSAGALLSERTGSTTQRAMAPPASTAIAPAFLVYGMATPGGFVDSATPLIPHRADRFTSFGASEGRRAASAMGNYSDHDDVSPNQPSSSSGLGASSGSKTGGKWGFLRKMSMKNLKSEKEKSTALIASATANLKSMPPPLPHQHSDPVPLVPRPVFNGAKSAMTLPTRKVFPPMSEYGEFGQATVRIPVTATTMPTSVSALPTMYTTLGSTGGPTGNTRGKRRSFLPIDPTPPSLNIQIPSVSPFMPTTAMFDQGQHSESPQQIQGQENSASVSTTASSSREVLPTPADADDIEARYFSGLESIKSYLRDLYDLSRAPIEPYGGFEVVGSTDAGSITAPSVQTDHPGSPYSSGRNRNSVSEARRARRPTLETQLSRNGSTSSVVPSEKSLIGMEGEGQAGGKKFKNDRSKRARVIREIYETERTYVRGLGELVSIYIRPSCQLVKAGQSETVVPVAERKIVFGGIESILTIHRDNLLPALEKAVRPLLEGTDDEEGQLSTQTAHNVGEVFRTYIAYMKQYSTYINNFDNALSRMKTWTASAITPTSSMPPTPAYGKPSSPNIASAISSAALSVGMMSAASLSLGDNVPLSGNQMTANQKKRVKIFLKRCREHPRHSQINLESYLLLPIQRVPRYKLLLEDLAMCTPPKVDGPRDTLDDALNEISGLASLMNEEKRDADSRLRLFHWQQRISSRGPSPLVQPHRKLILDGPLKLIRLVKKASSFVEVDNPNPIDDGLGGDGDATVMPSSSRSGGGAKAVVPVEYIAPEPMERPMMLILCTDLMVLVQQRPGAEGWEGTVDLFNVLRMATVREPASVVNGNVLRVLDNKSIYYFNGGSHSSALQWCRAINSARRR